MSSPLLIIPHYYNLHWFNVNRPISLDMGLVTNRDYRLKQKGYWPKERSLRKSSRILIAALWSAKILALKIFWSRAITPLNVTAAAAFGASKSGIYETNRYSFSLGFISHKSLKLSEAPTMQSMTLKFTRMSSTANIRVSEAGRSPVFKDYSCTFTYRLHQSFRKDMIAIAAKPCLSAGQLFEMSNSRLCAFALEATAQLKNSIFYLFPMLVTIKSPSTMLISSNLKGIP